MSALAGRLLSGLWAASLSAGVMTLAVLALRALFGRRTPRRLFCLLWDLVLVRLLLPVALPAPTSVWQWLPAVELPAGLFAAAGPAATDDAAPTDPALPDTAPADGTARPDTTDPAAAAGQQAGTPGTAQEKDALLTDAAPGTPGMPGTPGASDMALGTVSETTLATPDGAARPPARASLSVLAAGLLASPAGRWLPLGWAAGALALAGWFLFGHLRGRRRYADALPCQDPFAKGWLAAHPLRRRLQLRTSDRIAAPLTFGVLRPVLLLPAGMDWRDTAALGCILEHEYQHIRRFDTLRRGLLAAAVCLHWPDPLAWAVYAFGARDIELACDEAVMAQGADRAGYARTLLRMEERRGSWAPAGSHFSQNALEERIRAIMKPKKTSLAALLAVLLVTGVVAAVFATAAPHKSDAPADSGDPSQSDFVYDHLGTVEGEVMVQAKDGEEGEKRYSVDGGRSWMSEQAYRHAYGGSDWQIEWWTADDYAVWLQEEKQALQSVIGERAYTGGEGWFVWDQKRVDEAIALYEGILEDIRNGALYSKSITDQNGNAVEEIMLASGGQDAEDVLTVSGDETRWLDDEELLGLIYGEDEDPLPEPAVDEAAFLQTLRAYGVQRDDGQLTYKGQRVRQLVDGVAISNGYILRYVYTDLAGEVDLHTLRTAVHLPDGGYDPLGALTGVAAAGEPGFDQGLLEAADFAGVQQATTEGAGPDADAAAKNALAPYTAFGLQYEYLQADGETQLRMTWNGQPVHSLWDAVTGTWFANNLHGSELGEDAVDLEAVYQYGKLCGLQEATTPHTVTHMQTATTDSVTETETADAEDTARLAPVATAMGSAAKSGETLAEIFANYVNAGLVYTAGESGLGSLTWMGQPVQSFADLRPDGGAFTFEDPLCTDGLKVYTCYDEDGTRSLCAIDPSKLE